MDLAHSFTVPASVAETWATFEDIESVAGCFPGAVVTEVDDTVFKGTCKVKLGPIAMVYTGTGTFVEKDEAAGRFVIDALGKDKRGNGTAGARVTAVLTDEGGSTRVDVATDLSITGKPAQFGRGVIQDVSDKLLQQFVTCLQDRVGAHAPAAEVPAVVATEPATTPTTPEPPASSAAPTSAAPSSAAPSEAPSPRAPASDDALDLGATVLPVLLRSYGRQAGIAALLLLVGWLVGRRSR
ncbi:MAG: SRPBCC family protein [Nocardioidaceae bacterium]